MSFSQEEMDGALRRARIAQQAWAALPLSARLAPIRALRSALAVDPKPLAEVVANEIGKSRFEAISTEILPTAEVCRFLLDRAAALLAPRREVMRGTMPFSGSAVIQHLPWGVVAILVPWNYPLFLAAGPTLNALAAGNAVALKASPRAKETVAAFVQKLWDAGFPRDLVVALDSSDDAGRALTASALIDKIVFTGGSSTGRSVLAAAAKNLVPATIELSGFDSVFVLRDANVKLAADAVTFGVRLNGGRTCICPRRVFVDETVADDFIGQLKERLTRLKLSAPMDPQTLREADAFAEKLRATPGAQMLVERRAGEKEKALVLTGGTEVLAAAQGNFLPAIVVTKVKDAEDAMRLERESPYALGGSVFSQNVDTAVALASRLRAGIIGINECVVQAAEAALPFGGTGESGYGVRGGDEGLMEMTRPQSLAIARGTFRPHHVAESEAEDFVLALLRARHSGSWLARIKGWIDYAREGIAWKPPK
jgi:acyl-CoA reductase-like NAD-dependent aldehyde dehydrogenase